MFDTVNMYLPGRKGEFADVPKRLENCQARTNAVTGELQSYEGKIGGLNIRITRACLWIEKSLWKYAKGNNLTPFTRRETKDAIMQLSEALGVNIAEARVSRLDTAMNVILSRTPPEYFRLLGHSPCYKTRSFTRGGALEYTGSDVDSAQPEILNPGTLYFETKRRTLCLYDKKGQMHVEREEIPAAYDAANVLRFELRYLKKISEQLRRPVFLR